MKPFFLNRNIILWLALALLTNFILGAIIYRSFDNFRRADNVEIKLRQTAGNIDELYTLLKEAESARRGHVLTGEEEFLFLLNAANEPVTGIIDSLIRDFAENQAQKENLELLAKLVNEKMSHLRASVDLMKANGFNKDEQARLTVVGNKLMIQIQAVIERLRLTAKAVLDAHTAARAATMQRIIIFVFCAGILAIALISWFLVLLNRETVNRLHVEESRSRLADIVESSNDAIVGWDLKGKIRSWNRGAEQMYGYSVSEAVGTHISKLVPEARKGEIASILEKATKGEKISNYVTERIRKDKSVVGVSLSVSPVWDGEKKVIGVSIIAHDISERIKMEAELRYNNAMMSAQLEVSIDGVLVVDPSGKILSYNRRFARMWNIPDEVIETKSDELALRVVMDKLVDPKQFLAKVSYLYEHRAETSRDEIYLKGGLTFDRYSAPMLGTDGTYYGRIWYFRDITEQKKMEMALLESREYLSNIINTIGDPVFVKDEQCRFVVVNDALCTVLGKKSADLLGKTGGEFLPPAEMDHFLSVDRGVLATGESNLCEEELTGADGKVLTIVTRKTRYVNPNGDKFIVGVIRDITEQKKAVIKIQEQYSTLKGIIESNNSPVFSVDNNYHYTSFNRSHATVMKRIFNADIELGRSILEYHTVPADRELAKANIDRALGGEIHLVEGSAGEEARARLYFEVAHNPIRDESGRVIGAAIFARDITERKQMEIKIKENEDFLNSIVDNIPNMIFVKDAKELRFVRFNKAGEELLGMPREQLYGKNDYDFFPKAEANFFTAKDREVLNNNRLLDIPEEEIQTKNKGLRILHTKKIPILDEAGKPAYLLGISEDITDRKKIELALRSSKEYAEKLIETINAIFVSLDTQGRVTAVNKAAQRITGYSQEELLGCSWFEKIVPRATYGYVWDEFERLLKGGFPKHFENPILTKSGAELFIVWQNAELFENGKVTGTISFGLDITDRKKAEEALKKSSEKLKELNNSLRDQAAKLAGMNKELEAFSYSVSHDLRAPLRIINGFSEALAEDYADKIDAQGKEFIKLICSSTKQMERLIDDMLQLSQLSRKAMSISEVDLSAIVHSIADELQKSEPGRKVDFVIAPKMIASGDESLLRIILDNLIRNAWKFTSKHPTARIEAGTKIIGDKKVFFVSDDGSGFDMTYAHKLFVPFQRLHHAAEFPGTGIGLAIVQRIVSRHGGRVWAEGALEKGATIYFTLA